MKKKLKEIKIIQMKLKEYIKWCIKMTREELNKISDKVYNKVKKKKSKNER